MRHFGRYFWVVFLAIAIIGATPWFYRYQPAVVATPGHEMRWPTQPDLLDSVIKRCQAFWETKACDYIVQGWSSEGVLYYEEACKG